MRKFRVPSFAVIVLALNGARSANAGGYSLPVQGSRALSVGGALVAGAEQKDAFWYNPSRLRGSSVGLGLGLVQLDATYARSDGEQAGESISNRATPLPNPEVGASWQINEALTVGLAAYSPWGAQYSYPENGPQRYALVENQHSKIVYVHAAASLRLGDFSVGAGVQNVIGHIRQRVMLSGYTGLFGRPEDPQWDVLNEITLDDPLTFTANLGASYEAGPVIFGASVQFPYTISGEAETRVRLPSSVFFDPTTMEGDRTHLELPFPLIIRGGIQWQITSRFMIEGAVNFEGWSVQESLIADPMGNIVLHDVPALGDLKMRPIVMERRMRDTVSVHFGADAEILAGLHLRAGFFWEPSSFGDETFSVALFDDEKVSASLGLSWYFSSFRLDLSGARVFQGTREVTDSALRQINPTNPDQTTVVANGTYNSGFWAGGLSLVWLLDAFEEQLAVPPAELPPLDTENAAQSARLE